MHVSMDKRFREAVMSTDVQDVFRDIEKAQVCSFCASLPGRLLVLMKGFGF
jgi:hypothetical protein